MLLPDDARSALDDLVSGATDALGDRFVGAYVVGSFALGAADARSDLDVVVAVDGRARPDTEVALRALHARSPGAGGWGGRLDVVHADVADLRSPMTLGRRWLRAAPGSRVLVASQEGNTAHARWLLRERGVVLSGPAPPVVVAGVTPEALRAEALGLARARAEALEVDPTPYADPAAQPTLVLTACRTAHTAEHAEVVGAGEAARWALDHLPAVHHAVVAAALARRAAPPATVPVGAAAAAATRALLWDVVRLAGQAALEAREP